MANYWMLKYEADIFLDGIKKIFKRHSFDAMNSAMVIKINQEVNLIRPDGWAIIVSWEMTIGVLKAVAVSRNIRFEVFMRQI